MRRTSVPSYSLMKLAASFAAGIVFVNTAAAQGLLGEPKMAPTGLTRDGAVQHALVHNPALMTVRKQHGYAESALVIAKTYPYNPVFTGYVTQNGGPASAGITNRVYQEHYISLELELRGQWKHRAALGQATASRIELEISQQELALSIAVVRAFNTVLYRQKKLAFIDEGIKVNELQAAQIGKLADAGKVKAIDVTLVRADLASARAAGRGQAKTALTIARSDLRKLLGTLDDGFDAVSDLDVPMPATDPAALTQHALEQRPDLRARRAALCEVQASLRLLNANRFGNPNLGPYYEYDPTRVSYIGMRYSMPLAIFNSKKGKSSRPRPMWPKVNSEVSQIEMQVSQEVQAALARSADAGKWAKHASRARCCPIWPRRSKRWKGNLLRTIQTSICRGC